MAKLPSSIGSRVFIASCASIDQTNDAEVLTVVSKEPTLLERARLLYYMGQFYATMGNDRMALRCFGQVLDLKIEGNMECMMAKWEIDAAAK